MAPIVYRFLPASPEKARFLNPEEALVAKARAMRQVGDGVRVGSIVWSDIGATLADAKAWFTAASWATKFSTDMSIEVTILSVYVADKTQQRGFTVMTMSTIGFIGVLLVWENKRLDKKYGPRPELVPEKGIDPATVKTAVGEENYGSSFRYVL
ncbi:MAG: hypothetical protein Q9223_002532 [Gallowayella weberi]